MDMCSGGSLKEEWAYIFIEAPETEARVIFYNRFGHNPERVTCTCCGEDYGLSEAATLEKSSAYDRNCVWVSASKEDDGGHYEERGATADDIAKYGLNGHRKAYMTVEQYEAQPDVLVLREADIKASERKGLIPEQGYVWVE